MTIHIEIKEAPKVIADKETTVLGIFRQHPDITLQEVADKMGVSLRSIKILIKDLQAQGTSSYIPTIAGRLFFLKELAGPLVAECN